MKEQTARQKISKSPLYGYRKPQKHDDDIIWCNCSIPTLTSTHGIGGGQAHCLRCGHNWYH
jgi:hypothetical protein